LNEQATINGLVGHAQALVIGILGFQPSGNLFRRPVQNLEWGLKQLKTVGSTEQLLKLEIRSLIYGSKLTPDMPSKTREKVGCPFAPDNRSKTGRNLRSQKAEKAVLGTTSATDVTDSMIIAVQSS
jgi:hypothetical protein